MAKAGETAQVLINPNRIHFLKDIISVSFIVYSYRLTGFFLFATVFFLPRFPNILPELI